MTRFLLLAIVAVLVFGCAAAPPARSESKAGVQVLAFTASWCGPCKQAQPKLDELRAAGATVRVVDIDAEPALAAKYGVKSVPTFFVTADGKTERTESIVGLVKLVRKLLAIRRILKG